MSDERNAENMALVAQAELFSVTNQDEYLSGGEFLRTIKKQKEKITDFFKPIKDKINDALKEAREKEKTHLAPLEKAEAIIKAKMSRFQQAEEDRARAEAERKRAEMEAEAEKLRKEGKEELAEAVEFAPVLVDAPVKAEGISYRETWKFEIVNPADIPREYTMPDEKKIGALVRSLKQDCTIPGIRVYCEKTTVVR